MSNETYDKHIAELYLQYEHIKREIKRDREEVYEQMCKQVTALQKQNDLLRKQLEAYEGMKELHSFFKEFIKYTSGLMNKHDKRGRR